MMLRIIYQWRMENLSAVVDKVVTLSRTGCFIILVHTLNWHNFLPNETIQLLQC